MPLRISTFLDQEAINVYLDAIPKLLSAPIKLAFYALDERYSFLEIFNEWKPKDYEETALTKLSETDRYTLYKFNILLPDKFKIKCPKCDEQFFADEMTDKDILVYFLRFKEIPFAIIISNNHFKESDYTFSFFNKYYPFMTRILLRARQLTFILQKIEKNEIFGKSIYSHEFTLKRYYAGKETERHFKKRDFESIFKEAKDKNLWLDNITFRVPERGRIQLSRDGKIQIYDDLVFSNILSLIDFVTDSYNESYSLLSGVEESNKKGMKIQLKIVLDNSVFVENEDVEELLKHLNRYKDSDLTILSRNGAFF